MVRMRWDFLAELINEENLKVGYEIGVYKGDTMGRILERCPDIEWHGVDPWVVCPEYTVAHSGMVWDHDANYEKSKEIQEQYGERCILHRATSVDAAEEVEDESIDIIFIDGLHTYDGVMEDITAWFPKIKPEGYICGHDYNGPPRHQGVTDAVNECFGVDNINVDADLVWWVQKA